MANKGSVALRAGRARRCFGRYLPMKLWEKILVAFGVLMVGAPLAIVGTSILAIGDMCRNELYAEVLSPDYEHKAVVFQRDCGATTGFSTQISIISAKDELQNESGNIFIIDGQPARVSPEVRWLSDTELSIGKGLNGSEYKAERSWGLLRKVRISYGAGGS